MPRPRAGAVDQAGGSETDNWQRPSFDLASQSVGVLDNGTLIAYVEVFKRRYADATVHLAAAPRLRRRRHTGGCLVSHRQRRLRVCRHARRTRRPSGRGLARALLVDAFDVAQLRGAQRSELSTDSRTGALGLYLRVGMEGISVWQHLAIDV